MKAFFRQIPIALLILLYMYAAVSKLLTFDLFRVQLHRQPLPGPVADLLLYALPAAELLTVVLLLFRRTSLAGLLLSLVLLYFFSTYIALALLHFWRKVPCPCGGILEHLRWPCHLALNLCFLLINLLGIRICRQEKREALIIT